MVSNKTKIAVAMSGGVDSSVAAYLLKKDGYDVIGVTMSLWDCPRDDRARSCCSIKDRQLAREVCEVLKIPFVIADLKDEFKALVVRPFVDDYLAGRTPNPCVLCNSEMKFKILFDYMTDKFGTSHLATGHYARVVDRGGQVGLFKGRDAKKDQSYFLARMDQGMLRKALFPLGDLTKPEVRKIAKDAGLPTHEKKESQEICFVTDDDYVGFLEREAAGRLPGRGEFVDKDGKVLGHHDGHYAFTIGQRRGLGIGFAARKYVVGIDPAGNRVVLGEREELDATSLVAGEFLSTLRAKSRSDSVNFDAVVKIRYNHAGTPAHVKLSDNKTYVTFDEPVYAVTPGQLAVFYVGDEVLGSAWIIGDKL